MIAFMVVVGFVAVALSPKKPHVPFAKVGPVAVIAPVAEPEASKTTTTETVNGYPSERALVRAALRDPSSVEFRNEHYTSSVLCGEVNARNGFGGYVGYRRFIANRSTALFDGVDAKFALAWREFCR